MSEIKVKYVFYQLPVFLFEDSKFNKLSDSAKLLYSVLMDRLQLSEKHHWIDDKGNTYLIYTNQALQDFLGWSNKKVVSKKQELENAGLIKQKFNGLNKPNFIYIPEPNIQDVHRVEQKQAQSLDNKGRVKTTRPEKQAQSLDNKGNVKTTHNLYSYYLSNIDDEDSATKLTVKKLVDANLPLLYKGEVAKQQIKTISNLLSQFKEEEVNRIVDKMICNTSIKDAANYLITCLRNQLNDRTKNNNKKQGQKYIFNQKNKTVKRINSNKWVEKSNQLKQKNQEPIMTDEEMNKIFRTFGKEKITN